MSSFPTSKYARYKRATSFFLDWLLRARGHGRRGGKRVLLDEFNEVVEKVAAEPATLTPKLLQELPKALAACQCAITFREHVAKFFADDDGGQEGHRHFLDLLKNWYETLKTVETQQQQAAATSDSARFKNYYEVLQVDEDYFPDEKTLKIEKGAPKRAKADRNYVFDQAFDEDLKLEIAYFFLELGELVDEVYRVYNQVKKGERTMVEATVVVKVAMGLAEALTSGLQFRYPALQTAEDVLFVLMDQTSTSLKDRIAKLTSDVREKFETDGTYTFVPEMLLNDFTNVWWTLASFTFTVGTKEDKKDAYWDMVFIPDGEMGGKYGEERTPQYVFPDSDNVVNFLMQQLPMLYNLMRSHKGKHGSEYKRVEMVSHFLSLFEEYFDSRKVSVPLVFACICWIKSVTALQGDAGLGRNISITYKHSRKLMEKMETSAAKGGSSLCTEKNNCARSIRESPNGHALTRVNPLLAGFIMLTHHLKYLLLASSHLLPSKRLRSFSILYIALVDQGFMEHIPYFDELMEIYEDRIFTPSRTAVIHGDYNRVHLLSGHSTRAAVDAIYQGVLLPSHKLQTKQLDNNPWDSSSTYQLVLENNMSCLRGVSSKTMLQKAADICSKELFQTRILSRDLMTLHDDLADTFSEMCDVLGRRQFCQEYMAGESGQDATINATVTAVTFPLLSLMDALQPDGSMRWSALPVGLLTQSECAVTGEQVRNMCRGVAAVIKARFATPSLVCEQKYVLFPSKPDFVTQEYGAASFKTITENENRQQVFADLMNLLLHSNGPLSGSDLNYLKSEIRQDPELLRMFSRPNESDTDSSSLDGETPASDDELCTLLHHAAAGPAHDTDLVEWMIQMGALINQPVHCRKDPQEQCSRETLPNTMAVHSAATAGYEGAVRMILEADNLVDLNTPTFHSKDTLAHLAVKHGHRKLLHLLRYFGANVFLKNSEGKHVGDLVAERGWSNESATIFASLALLEKTSEDTEGDATFCLQVTKRVEWLRGLIFTQRDEERQADRKNGKQYAADVWKKNKQIKKRREKGNAALLSPGIVKTNSPKALHSPILLPTNVQAVERDDSGALWLTDVETSLAKTSSVFARLRDPSIPAVDKTTDIERACLVIRKLKGLTDLLSAPKKLTTTKVELRMAVSFEAHRVIHMMQKFYRVDHAALLAPAFTPVRNLCGTTHEFTKFVVDTAKLCASVNRYTQAHEVLDLLEKRLAKNQFAQRKPSTYRELMQMHSAALDALGTGRMSSLDKSVAGNGA